MNKTFITGIIGLFFGYSCLLAQGITQTREFQGTPNFTETFEFEKYHGTSALESVQVIFEIETEGGFLAVDNDYALPIEVTVDFGVRGMIASNNAPLIGENFHPVISAIRAVSSTTVNLSGDDGDGRERMELNTPDAAKYAGTRNKASNSGKIASRALDNFSGSGTFALNVILSNIVNVGNNENMSASFEAPHCSGRITIIYN